MLGLAACGLAARTSCSGTEPPCTVSVTGSDTTGGMGRPCSSGFASISALGLAGHGLVAELGPGSGAAARRGLLASSVDKSSSSELLSSSRCKLILFDSSSGAEDLPVATIKFFHAFCSLASWSRVSALPSVAAVGSPLSSQPAKKPLALDTPVVVGSGRLCAVIAPPQVARPAPLKCEVTVPSSLFSLKRMKPAKSPLLDCSAAWSHPLFGCRCPDKVPWEAWGPSKRRPSAMRYSVGLLP
mmetsp:Transcript_114390/g.277790  ORF Transcript_114390/g.277790 Transcript_114390/m.277790 type:complete len:242 (-) Transcript_114390:110-835(-)